MHRALGLLFAVALLVSGAWAQVSARPNTSTTTTTTQTTTVTGPEHNVEGCLLKEAGEFFLIPERGEPFLLQPAANQDLSPQEGHRVMVSGKEMSAAQNAAAAGATGTAAQATGTGNDLHQLANRRLVADGVRSVATTCHLNWSPVITARER